MRCSQRFAVCVLVAGAVCAASSLHAQSTAGARDSSAIVHVAEAMLRAISTRDTALARTLLLPGAQLVAVGDGPGPARPASAQTDAEFYRSLGAGTARFTERMWNPDVWQHGTLAVVRAPYDFHIDGKFSHCGVDVFLLVQSQGAWRVSSITYTAQRTGCAPSPLGALSPGAAP
jgi:hypothetical protein